MSNIRGENDLYKPGDRYIRREPQENKSDQQSVEQINQQSGVYEGIYFGKAAPCRYIKTLEELEPSKTGRTR